MSTTYEEDVRFIGAFARGGKWEIALRIARRVEIGNGQGERTDLGTKCAEVHERHSLAKIARDTGLHRKTVQKYLATWEWAANDGVVDPSAELSLDTEYDWEASGIGQDEWDEYYETAMLNPPPWNPQGAPLEPRVGPKRSSRDVTPAQIAEAIQESPQHEQAAWEAITEKAAERTAPQRKQKREPTSPSTMEEWTRMSGKFAAARRLLEEVLGAAMNIRGFAESKGQREATLEMVAEIRVVLDAIAGVAEGESLDEEWKRLAEGIH